MLVIKYVSWLTTCAVFVAFLSILIQAYWASQNLTKLTTILTGLIALENSISITKSEAPRIAVGYGSCSDLYVRATQFLKYSDINNSSDGSIKNDISNEEDLFRSFAYYFQNGAASERFTSNQDFFRKLVARVKSKNVGKFRWALGGNAPIMGMRFAKEGAKVLLAAQMTKKLRQSVPSSIAVTGDPIEFDDVHLIMEYNTDEQWGPFVAPRANRYILHNDQNNPTISSLESLEKELSQFDPKLFVVSGLQMLDSYPFKPNVRKDRLQKLEDQLKMLQKTTLIHFEAASFVEKDLLALLRKHVIPYSDSIGMNEQEIDNIFTFITTGNVSYASESNPRIAKTLHQMRFLFRLFNVDYDSDKESSLKRRLTRMHVHTLAYQAIMTVKDSKWKNTKNAAAKAALTAHRHVCASNIVNPESSMLIIDDSFSTAIGPDDPSGPHRIHFKPNDPVSCWNEHFTNLWNEPYIVEICIAPVLVCKVARQTVGAGDNISAAGLILQI